MPDRTVAPAFVKSTSFELIQPDKRILANGLEVFLIHGGAQDVMKIELIFQAGRWFEKKWGASHFSSHLLSKGTRFKDSFQIAEIFDRYGAHLEVSAGLDVVSVSLYLLTKKLTPVLHLLREILQEPIFPEKELKQSKSIYVQNLKVNYEKTSFLASKLFRKSLFGDDHPYGKELEEKDVNRLAQESLFDHYQEFLQSFTVFVSGKIDRDHEDPLTDIFSSWELKAGSVPGRKTAAAPAARQYVEKQDSVQSSIRMGRTSITRKHPDYAESVFAGHVLGGYFGSRLMKNIREEKGLTYGIYASLHPLKHGSYLVVGADVNKENINQTTAEIRKELDRLCSEPISSDELETARNHFIGSLQSEITTPFAHADKWKTIYLNNLPPSHYQDMIARIEAIDAHRLMEVCRVHFNEKDFSEVAVG